MDPPSVSAGSQHNHVMQMLYAHVLRPEDGVVMIDAPKQAFSA